MGVLRAAMQGDDKRGPRAQCGWHMRKHAQIARIAAETCDLAKRTLRAWSWTCRTSSRGVGEASLEEAAQLAQTGKRRTKSGHRISFCAAADRMLQCNMAPAEVKTRPTLRILEQRWLWKTEAP
jgi:hypothetical protein